jgi:hypothetical protein
VLAAKPPPLLDDRRLRGPQDRGILDMRLKSRARVDAGHDILEVRLGLILLLDHVDHVAADYHHAKRRCCRIQDRGNHQITRDRERALPDADLQRSTDVPQHGHKGAGYQER